jgi:hypothetical protein
MILNEILDNVSTAYDDPSQDHSRPALKDLRKTKLTLRQIQKLRMVSDVRRFEQEKRLTTIKKQYGVQPAQ